MYFVLKACLQREKNTSYSIYHADSCLWKIYLRAFPDLKVKGPALHVVSDRQNNRYNVRGSLALKEARNSFLGLGVYLLKSKFRIEGKLRFP